MNNILCQRIGIYARLSVRNTEREEVNREQLLLVGQYLVNIPNVNNERFMWTMGTVEQTFKDRNFSR